MRQFGGSQQSILAASALVAMLTFLLLFIFQRQLVEPIKASGFK